MNIGVARRTVHRRQFERRFGEPSIGLFRFVALIAGDLLMRPEEGKGGLGMVECWQVGPSLHRMAGFTSLNFAVGPLFVHLRHEASLVRVLMASCA